MRMNRDCDDTTYCYKHEKSLPSNLSLMVGKRVLQGKYEMTDSSHVWTPDLGDEIWGLKGAGIFSISLLVEEIRLTVQEDSM
ncbi:hypothetical protein AVEN_16033-1 [Araneus ventricosus]|uniref:Uncharacterized protein n=1 Tax=Araneus ventricosus TaxID=182803 RepID=A0A4Y2E5U6_ARAVE|nr:hypothetical protein AVEN_16033-1 [Araneus ventricosus]